MAKKKNRRKKNTNATPKLKPANYIRKVARKLPILECRITEDWEETGICRIMVARQKPGGAIVTGEYVVDLYCLGVKNSSFNFLDDHFSYENLIERVEDQLGIGFTPIDPELAFNIVYGAVEYAEDLGFPPHKSFELTEYLLKPVEELTFIDVEFGKDGKPLYVEGPHDDAEMIYKKLASKVGVGNFDYLISQADLPGQDLVEPEADDYYPEDLIEQKIAEMTPHNQLHYTIQTMAARLIMDACEGDLETLATQVNNNEDFVLDLIDQLNKIFEIRDEDQVSEEVWDSLISRSAIFVIEKILENQGLYWLYEKDYLPTVNPKTSEELEAMDEADRNKYLTSMIDKMTIQEGEKFYLENWITTKLMTSDKPLPVNEAAKLEVFEELVNQYEEENKTEKIEGDDLVFFNSCFDYALKLAQAEREEEINK